MLQQLDLTQGALGEDLLAEDICDLLDSDAFARLVVGSRAAGGLACIRWDGEGAEYQTMP